MMGLLKKGKVVIVGKLAGKCHVVELTLNADAAMSALRQNNVLMWHTLHGLCAGFAEKPKMV
jgi:hypothetical protein